MKSSTMILAIASSAFAVHFAGATPIVSSVDMTQTSKRVDITYTLTGEAAVITLDIQTNANTSAAADDPGWTSIGGEAVCNAQGDVWKKVETGSRAITWRPDQSWPDHVIAANGARAVVTAWSLDNTPDYMVVDISAAAQPNTQRYYPAVDFLPGSVAGQKGAVTNNPAYKTSMLVMRKIMAKDVTWIMGSTPAETLRNPDSSGGEREATHEVTLTNNYYIGIYEVTQSQWGEVATNSTSKAIFAVEGSMRPMERACYNAIRNAHYTGSDPTLLVTAGANGAWPNPPSSDSFLGLLNAKTGLDFDLPSEAQWEFACRAGHGSGYWNDGSVIQNVKDDTNLLHLARSGWKNWGATPDATWPPSSNGTAIVGSYLPNSWGLYDMHGNVMESCLDRWEVNIATAVGKDGKLYAGRVNIDPDDPTRYLSGNEPPDSSAANRRLVRGGCWSYPTQYCRSAYRMPTAAHSPSPSIGFRVVCTAGLQ